MKFIILITLCLSSLIHAQVNRSIYPFKPFPTKRIIERASTLTENPNYISNVFTMEKMGLSKAWLKNQPWSGSYWPLIQGLAAADYSQNRKYKLNDMFSWKSNYKEFKNRKASILNYAKELEEWQLDLLAPSEKYDLILGDYDFDLTHRLWDYTHKWGKKKQYAFLTNIEWPRNRSNWVLEDKSERISLWEGICHGWATAAGHVERPAKTIQVAMPGTNKKIKFYPNDVKALISLLWANSTIQDKVLMEGFRCNTNKVKKDKHGRYIDKKPETAGEDWLPRCADVHPALLHIVLANVLGKDQRSFVMDVKAKASVSNQPVAGYTFSYYNPRSGKYYGLKDSIITKQQYGGKDPFRKSRNRDTRYIVGVKVNLYYTDWVQAKQFAVDAPEYDKVDHTDFYYDLELDANYNIIGGQWRSTKKSKSVFRKFKGTDQPDFIWMVPKDWKKSFADLNLEPWSNKRAPMPSSWKSAAHNAHSFIYNRTREFGWDAKCKIVHKQTERVRKVPCEFKIPQPQPLVNVVNELLRLSK